ncbi:MAG: helix-turn-helix transcriptional regulator [Burkholderiaceae bacterium]
MATTQQLVNALKRELRAAGLTYRDLSARLEVSESSVKRMFSRGEITLARIDRILALLSIDFTDLARGIADTAPLPNELTEAQERALVAERELLLVAICCQSEWRYEQILEFYRLTPAELIARLVRLDAIGVIHLRANNRYSLRLAKGFRWRPHGPVMAYFRAQAMTDFFSGGFDGDAEILALTHGSVSVPATAAFVERLQRLIEDFARQHRADHRLDLRYRQSRTLLVAMRDWEFSAFRDLVR